MKTRYSSVQKVVGFLIALSSLMMLPPAAVSWWYHDGTAILFMISAAILLSAGLFIYFPVRKVDQDLRIRDGFLIVVGCWVALAVVGALPFLLLQTPQLSYIDALFESMSGLTTTGATVITSGDMSCLMHLDGIIRRQSLPIRVMHLAEILNGERTQ